MVEGGDKERQKTGSRNQKKKKQMKGEIKMEEGKEKKTEVEEIRRNKAVGESGIKKEG